MGMSVQPDRSTPAASSSHRSLSDIPSHALHQPLPGVPHDVWNSGRSASIRQSTFKGCHQHYHTNVMYGKHSVDTDDLSTRHRLVARDGDHRQHQLRPGNTEHGCAHFPTSANVKIGDDNMLTTSTAPVSPSPTWQTSDPTTDVSPIEQHFINDVLSNKILHYNGCNHLIGYNAHLGMV